MHRGVFGHRMVFSVQDGEKIQDWPSFLQDWRKNEEDGRLRRLRIAKFAVEVSHLDLTWSRTLLSVVKRYYMILLILLLKKGPWFPASRSGMSCIYLHSAKLCQFLGSEKKNWCGWLIMLYITKYELGLINHDKSDMVFIMSGQRQISWVIISHHIPIQKKKNIPS